MTGVTREGMADIMASPAFVADAVDHREQVVGAEDRVDVEAESGSAGGHLKDAAPNVRGSGYRWVGMVGPVGTQHLRCG
ncbi:hypothetical protein [Streptomyces sp. NPDC092952]|uniref:hypothetical protein n=1 Tax=Streptomyces sp. NPDC092952 TaxID=3366018 RepID=UPI0038233186